MIDPAKVKSKKPRVMSEYVFNESETKRFVLEPIKVVIPPNIAT